jgi:hypothetical protein
MIALAMAANESRTRRWIGCVAATAALIASAGIARADESGVSFWLPGQFGSLAAVPGTPGWSMAAVYYHASVEGSGSVAAAREIQVGRIPATVNVNLNANLNGQGDLMFLAPTYTFATPVLGGQLAMGITGIFGRSSADINGTLTTAVGPFATTRVGSIGDSITSVGDLYPMISLKWNNGVNNYMTYATGDIPVGDYDPNRLAKAITILTALQTSASVTAPSTAAAATPISIRQPGTNFQASPDLPTISRIPIRNIGAALIFTSIGARPNFSRSRFSSVLSDTRTSKSRTTVARTRYWADSSRAFWELDPRLGTSFRSAICRDI